MGIFLCYFKSLFLYQCDKCDFSAALKGELRSHKGNFTWIEDGPAHCDKCGFMGAMSEELRSHKNSFTVIEPYHK